jgi:DNA-binding transcriptional LysR family regulator
MTGERLKRTLLIDKFQERFPDLRVELIVGDRYFDLSKGEADIAIRSQGPKLDDETLVGRKIAEGVWGVYASPAYVKRHGRPQRPEDIAQHKVIQCTGSLASPDYAEGREILRRLWQQTSDSRSKSLSRQVASRISRAPQPP